MKIPGERHMLRIVEILVLILLVGLTGAVMTAESLHVADLWLLEYIYALRSPIPFIFFSEITALGSATVIALVSLALGLALSIAGRMRMALGLLVAVFGSISTETLMKIIIERTRPEGFSDLLPTSYSFPSGHATASMALYGFIIYLLFMLFPKYRVLTGVLGGAVIALVGLSRLYLGVHYPSDVVGGYLLAFLWILIGARIVHWPRTR
jgi:membrane-associated phospholipid phosphatase